MEVSATPAPTPRDVASFATTPTWSSGPTEATQSVALGDIDGDGDLDLVCGNSYTASNALYLNTGSGFATTPAWSGPAGNTASVALGDVDGDGDLDLVCGNWGSPEGQSNTLYLNTGGSFATTPAWSGPAGYTVSVALGDIDGDGDLDLVCGNWSYPDGQSNTLYLNTGGSFATTPAWSSGPTDHTTSVALGDIDGDGDLDLVCGNSGESNTLYLNTGGSFTDTPAWSSGPMEATGSVALGDIDGDGDLDLVCGNRGESNTLYLNTGGGFATTPAWSSELAENTTSVSLGDVDGDGDLDLVCGNSGESQTLYLNTGGSFAATPAWSSGPAEETQSITLGDVDGDGDLDLVCGNYYQSNTLYLNTDGTFAIGPVWSSGPAETQSVTLGDIDGDGDLDLVCGNSLYLNTGGSFTSTPAWSAGFASSTQDVALGDIDGDGDLDLVCGNYGRNTLYLNTSGNLATAPAWSSGGPGDDTKSVALGDVDGDGDLDLVCGNSQSNTLYLNTGGSFAGAPAWSGGPAEITNSVALGDIDGDGDLDLVCGNSQSNTLYLNTGGSFASAPAWSSGPADVTASVALGDIDGDGDLDLVCGNWGYNTLYLNTGGSFADTPTWSSGPTEQTSGIALGDIDGDGDLDLVCGNTYQSNTLYVNMGGSFANAPAWSSGSADQTTSVALGDIDSDGDLDLVCGNSGESTLYLAIARPPFKGDPLHPTNQLPNNGAHLRHVGIVHRGPSLDVVFTVVDVEADSVQVLAEYQFSGQPLWSPVALDGLPRHLATSPAGEIYQVTLDTRLVPFDSRPMVLRLRTIEIPRRVSLIQHVASYLITLGRVTPHRPQLAASADDIEFASVTVGDTVKASLTLRNVGNQPLIVSSITLPSTELHHDAVLPDTIPAGQERIVRFEHTPVVDLGASGEILIQSNDPLTSVKTIRTQRNTQALRFTRRLVPATQPVPLGEQLVLLVTPAEFVHVERAFVHLHVPGLDSTLTLALQVSELDLSATIPGDLVTEAGLEYWVEVRNDPAPVVTDPPDAPSSTYSVTVQPASRLTAIPVSTTDFSSGSQIRVVVEAQRGAQVHGGALHYRAGGAIAYERADLVVESPSRSFALIPGEAVGPRGLEYWVEATTTRAGLVEPPGGGDDPAKLRTTVTELGEASSHAARVYRMVSVPLDFGSSFRGSLETVMGFGSTNPAVWRVFRWNPGARRYLELLSENDEFVVRPGRAFWLVMQDGHRFVTRVGGRSVPTDSSFALTLSPGWNQIGNPFAFPVAWESVVRPDSVEAPYHWADAGPWMGDVQVLQPFDGYFVMNNSQSAVVIRVPPVEAAGAASDLVAGVAPATGPASDNSGGWRMQAQVATAGVTDVAHLGVAADAASGWDRLDRSDPPGAPGRSVSLYFPHDDWAKYSKTYATDIRSLADGHDWRFDVSKSFTDLDAGDPVRLTFHGVDAVPAALRVVLLDHELDRELDLRAAPDYDFVAGIRGRVPESEARFTLLVGDDAFVGTHREALSLPLQTRLLQNRPNPFRRGTVLRYELARPGRVQLEVFDVRGRLVRLVDSRLASPGRYEVTWDGTDSRGRPVAAGVYLYRLRAQDFSATRKMLVVQ